MLVFCKKCLTVSGHQRKLCFLSDGIGRGSPPRPARASRNRRCTDTRLNLKIRIMSSIVNNGSKSCISSFSVLCTQKKQNKCSSTISFIQLRMGDNQNRIDCLITLLSKSDGKYVIHPEKGLVNYELLTTYRVQMKICAKKMIKLHMLMIHREYVYDSKRDDRCKILSQSNAQFCTTRCL